MTENTPDIEVLLKQYPCTENQLKNLELAKKLFLENYSTATKAELEQIFLFHVKDHFKLTGDSVKVMKKFLPELSTKVKEDKAERDAKVERDAKLAKLEADSNKQKPEGLDLPSMLCGCFIPSPKYEVWTGKGTHVCGETVLNMVVKEMPFKIPILSCQAMVTGFYECSDDGTKLVDIQFTTSDTVNGGIKWETITVPSHAILTKEGFKKEIMPKGLVVKECNISSVIDYFDECIKSNKDKEGSAFKCGSACSSTGWTDNTFTAFKLGSRLIRDVDGRAEIFEALCVNNELTEKLTKAGTLEEWVKCMKPILLFPRMRFVIYDAMASLLLRLLKISPHAGLIISATTEGKTTALQGIASTYGNPDEYGEGVIYNGDTSITGANAVLHMYYDMPTMFDETTNSGEKFRKTFTYLIGNAQAPLRGKIGGELRNRDNHMSNSYIAAEEALVHKGMNDGGNNRAIPFYERLIPGGNATIVDAAKLGMKYNYGHIIELFLDKIFINRIGLRAYFENAKNRLAATTTDDRIKRQAAIFAATETSGFLLDQVFTDIGMCFEDTTETVVNMMWRECTIKNIEKPMAYNALEVFDDWYKSNFNTHGLKHDEVTETYEKNDGSYGVRPLRKGNIYIWDDDTWIDVLKSELDKELERQGFTNLNGIYKHWTHVFKLQEIDSCENRYTKQTRHCKSVESSAKDKVRVVRIYVDKMHQCLGMTEQTTLAKFGGVKPVAPTVKPESEKSIEELHAEWDGIKEESSQEDVFKWD